MNAPTRQWRLIFYEPEGDGRREAIVSAASASAAKLALRRQHPGGIFIARCTAVGR